MSTIEASIATRRFGLGPRPGDLKRIAADPRGYVLAAIERRDGALLDDTGFEPSHVSLVSLREAVTTARMARGAGKEVQGIEPPRVPNQAMLERQEAAPPASGPKDEAAMARPREIIREVMQKEASARLARAVATDQPFLERLVLFWSNHFSISALKGPQVRVIAGAYEREAIRPHVLGRFADMLKAVEQHPAMLIYLDNARSTGPNSPAGLNRGRGLNENLAREILELHTLGVDGGYTQADVTNFARIITGWTVAGPDQARGEPGKFFFARARHEPGAWPVLGKTYEDRGLASGESVLTDLARHRATARHIANKLAVHFISDDPPAALVDRLERAFLDSDGNLAVVAKALVSNETCWQASAKKLVPPYDFVVSLTRGLAFAPNPGESFRLAGALGQPLWQPGSPKGWPDEDDAWTGPSAIGERLRIAERVAKEIDRSADPRALAEDLAGDALSEHTRLAIARAETREQGFELLAMSPELQRR